LVSLGLLRTKLRRTKINLISDTQAMGVAQNK
jgi:hypothetical protein